MRKAKSYQTNNQITEIKEAIHVILTFSLHLDSCVWIQLLIWEPDYVNMNLKWYTGRKISSAGFEPTTLVVPAMLVLAP